MMLRGSTSLTYRGSTSLTYRQTIENKGVEISDSDFMGLRDISPGRETDSF